MINPVQRAHYEVARAVRNGTLVRAAQCEECGSSGDIQAAHYDYADSLRVRWLCRSCHRRWDTADPKPNGIHQGLIGVRLQPAIYRRLEAIAKRQKRSLSAQVALLVEEWLAAQPAEETKPKR